MPNEAATPVDFDDTSPTDTAGSGAADTLPRSLGETVTREERFQIVPDLAPLQVGLGEWATDVLLASVAEPGVLGVRLPRGGRAHVPTLTFGPADALDVLAAVPRRPQKTCGDSLRYWAILGEFVLSLLARQQFVPDVEERPDGSFAALWRPFAQRREELAWLEWYASVMPPVCLSAEAVEPGAESNPSPSVQETAALRVVEDFVNATVDAVIRRLVADDPFFERIHERARTDESGEVHWLSALLGTDRAIHGRRPVNMELADRVRSWVGRLDEGPSAESLRLCFTLAEPAALETTSLADATPQGNTVEPPPEQPWRLALHLETVGDAHTRLSVPQVWAEPGGRPTILGRHLGHRRDHLLAEFNRAIEMTPLLEPLRNQAPPEELTLTPEQAHVWVREAAPLLSARGFGVYLPAWATRTERRLGMRLHLRPPVETPSAQSVVPSGIGLDHLLEFDWHVAVGEVQLSPAEFERLAAQQTPLVRYGNDWLELDLEEARAALTFMRERPGGRMSLGAALRVAYGVEDLDAGLPILGLSGGDWVEQLLREVEPATLEPLPQPTAFHGTLRPYQRRGLDWLVFLDRLGIGACLADDMGLGKTIQLIALLLHERQLCENVGPTLVFAPASVVGNWEREIQRFAGAETALPQAEVRATAPRPTETSARAAALTSGSPPNPETSVSTTATDPSGPTEVRRLRVLVHHGPERLAGEAFVQSAEEHDVVVTTYALGHRDLADLGRVRWHRIVLDEAQKVKNPQARQTMAIRSLRAPHRVALTGTPVENHLPELWSIMNILNPGLLGTPGAFRKRFVVPIEKQGDRRREARLRKLLRPFILRRMKSDPSVIRDLPEKMEMRVYCNLTPEQARLYQQVVDETMGALHGIAGMQRRGLILSLLTRLKQTCNHPCHLLGELGPLDQRSGKSERLIEMLEEVLAEGDAALVFTQYRRMGDLLEQLMTTRLQQEVLYLHGGVPTRQRDRMVQRFQEPAGGPRIFLLSLRAGGLGLNLTAANHVFHFDRWWNPAVEAQATDRAHRVGQTRRVQVHKFVCIGTVEERIDRMLEDKRALAENIIGSGDGWLTELSTDELRHYVSLSREAVG